MKITPALLIILDGFGHREDCDDNAICQARKPHWNVLRKTCPHTIIDASEKWVGLPALQMGNSEVGHMNIGAGRVVYQDYTKIEHAIETGEFATNPVIGTLIKTAGNGALHVLGLLSPVACTVTNRRFTPCSTSRPKAARKRFMFMPSSTAATRRRKARRPR
jgi:2,3-bisphosphoglycerate-independent phosphoglycerate mutase